MDNNKTPEQILDEIMNRTPSVSAAPVPPEPDPPSTDLSETDLSGTDPPGDSPPPPPEPETEAAPDNPVKLPARWQTMALGAALLMLAMCVVLLAVQSTRLSAIENALAEVQLMDSIQEENKTLERENKVLQQDKEKVEQELAQNNYLLQDARQAAQDLQIQAFYQSNYKSIQLRQSQYLWFMDRFMDAGDYPMTAIVMVAKQDLLVSVPDIWSIPDGMNGSYPEPNSAQLEQYGNLQAELINRGYIQLVDDEYVYGGSLNHVDFSQQWHPEQNQDMMILSSLWSMLDEYYVAGLRYRVAQWIVEYDLDDRIGRVSETAGEYTLKLYRQMLQELVEEEYLVETEDGYEQGNSDDIYYDPLFTFSFPDEENASTSNFNNG